MCVCVSVFFFIIPTPPWNSRRWFSTLILSLSIFFPHSPHFSHLSEKMVLCSLPLTSSFHLKKKTSISLFPSLWCLWPVLIYASWSYSNCHPCALWDRHVTCGAPRPNVMTSSVCLSYKHWHMHTQHSRGLFICNTAALPSDLCRLPYSTRNDSAAVLND